MHTGPKPLKPCLQAAFAPHQSIGPTPPHTQTHRHSAPQRSRQASPRWDRAKRARGRRPPEEAAAALPNSGRYVVRLCVCGCVVGMGGGRGMGMRIENGAARSKCCCAYTELRSVLDRIDPCSRPRKQAPTHAQNRFACTNDDQ
jgi:hypothetical protein